MSELTLTVIRLGFLVVLWTFVLAVAGVMRTDLFGQRVAQRAPSPGQGKAARPARTPKPPKAQRATARTLVITEGSLAGTTLTLGDQPIVLGRAADSTVVLDDDYVSNRHARLYPYDGRWVVEDLGSTNGTYLDRTKVTAPTLVPVGTPLRVGKTVFELRK